MKKILFTGSGVALVTPFSEDGINYEVLKELIEFHIENKTDAIIVCGTTGEPSTMTFEEWKSVIEFTVKNVDKRIPVIAGTGSNDTRVAVMRTQIAKEIGVDGVLVVTPYYNKTTQRGIIAHYKEINEVGIPVIVYNVPSRTGLNLTSKTALELSKLPNIVAIKEASGNFSQIAEIASLCGDELHIYSGNDDQVVPVLSLGGKGVISVSANVIPNDTHRMVKSFLDGNIEESRKLQLKAIDLINTLFFETNPIPVKEAVRQIGFDVGKCRLPLVDVDEEGQIRISKSLENYFK